MNRDILMKYISETWSLRSNSSFPSFHIKKVRVNGLHTSSYKDTCTNLHFKVVSAKHGHHSPWYLRQETCGLVLINCRTSEATLNPAGSVGGWGWWLGLVACSNVILPWIQWNS